MPLRNRNLVLLSDCQVLQILQVDSAASQKVGTVADEALISVHDIKDDRRRIRKALIVHEIEAYFLGFHEDWVHVVLNNSCLHVLPSGVEDLDEGVRAAVTVCGR